MRHLLTLGLSILAFHSPAHHKRYWWPATDTCIVGARYKGGTFYFTTGASHTAYCYTVPAGYRNRPFPGYSI